MKGWIALAAAMCCATTNAAAQKRTPSYLQFGVGFYAFHYHGDLTAPGEGWHRFHPGGNLAVQFEGPKRLYPQINFGLTRFTAQNRNLPGLKPNKYVQTTLWYLSAELKVRILRKTRVRPHVGVGLGLLGFTPKDEKGNSLVENETLREEGEIYGSVAPLFPLSVGVQYRVNRQVSLQFDVYQLFSTTDYTDNIGRLGTVRGSDHFRRLQLSVYLTVGQRFRPGREEMRALPNDED
ncbi:MAG: outer membrane beta-barrel protein [Bacteroidia bacterium]|nr:porin family protein [Bacteroidia bacterium]MDW8333354.1 outer membrane beta-barrel protein [Bacteroidia bacterium]